MPGRAERWTARGGAGRPESAWTIGTLVIARAGREAAKYAATTANTIAATTTGHERASAPIRWCELCSRCGR